MSQLRSARTATVTLVAAFVFSACSTDLFDPSQALAPGAASAAKVPKPPHDNRCNAYKPNGRNEHALKGCVPSGNGGSPSGPIGAGNLTAAQVESRTVVHRHVGPTDQKEIFSDTVTTIVSDGTDNKIVPEPITQVLVTISVDGTTFHTATLTCVPDFPATDDADVYAHAETCGDPLSSEFATASGTGARSGPAEGNVFTFTYTWGTGESTQGCEIISGPGPCTPPSITTTVGTGEFTNWEAGDVVRLQLTFVAPGGVNYTVDQNVTLTLTATTCDVPPLGDPMDCGDFPPDTGAFEVHVSSEVLAGTTTWP